MPHINESLPRVFERGTEENRRRRWHRGVSGVPAVVLALLSPEDWEHYRAPDTPTWNKKRHRAVMKLRDELPLGPWETEWSLEFERYFKKHELVRWWFSDARHSFRAPSFFMKKEFIEANTLGLDPVEIANLRPPPGLDGDRDFLAIQAWCSGITNRFRALFMVDVTVKSCTRGIQKICNNTAVKVALASKHVRYLNGVRIRDGFRENLEAVKATISNPMLMNEEEMQAWENSSVLDIALNEEVAIRKGKIQPAGYRPDRPRTVFQSWIKGWRYYDLTLIGGERRHTNRAIGGEATRREPDADGGVQGVP